MALSIPIENNYAFVLDGNEQELFSVRADGLMRLSPNLNPDAAAKKFLDCLKEYLDEMAKDSNRLDWLLEHCQLDPKSVDLEVAVQYAKSDMTLRQLIDALIDKK